MGGRMKILVACEESQAVTIEFRKFGHEAYSCDIEPCSGGHPEWHLQQDVIPLLNLDWDIIIAFPPCTYLTNAAARHLYKGGVLNYQRYLKGCEAREFFMKIYNSNCKKIVIENPKSSKIYDLPPFTQEIQPYMFGHPVTKKTRLWIKGLPLLNPTDIIQPIHNCHEAGTWFMVGGKDRQKNRSKTFSGVAAAMAEQWSNIDNLEDYELPFYEVN